MVDLFKAGPKWWVCNFTDPWESLGLKIDNKIKKLLTNLWPPVFSYKEQEQQLLTGQYLVLWTVILPSVSPHHYKPFRQRSTYLASPSESHMLSAYEQNTKMPINYETQLPISRGKVTANQLLKTHHKWQYNTLMYKHICCNLFIYFLLASYKRTQWFLNQQPYPPLNTYKWRRC